MSKIFCLFLSKPVEPTISLVRVISLVLLLVARRATTLLRLPLHLLVPLCHYQSRLRTWTSPSIPHNLRHLSFRNPSLTTPQTFYLKNMFLCCSGSFILLFVSRLADLLALRPIWLSRYGILKEAHCTHRKFASLKAKDVWAELVQPLEFCNDYDTSRGRNGP